MHKVLLSRCLLVSWVFTCFPITANASPNAQSADVRLAPGDNKTGYTSENYKTDSLSLEYRRGQPADLLKISKSRQLGLPAAPGTDSGKVTRAKIQLGRKLFFDRRLSRNQTMSCAMCHIPEQGFTSNELARPVGFEGRALKRNAPTILNVAYMQRLFADARESTLEQQIWSPLLAPNEMNNPSVGSVVDLIHNSNDYNNLFETAFNEPANMLNIGVALALYERSLISANSRFDHWLFGERKDALSKQEITGYQLFVGKAGCSACHQINQQQGYALFTDNLLHNTGLGYRDSMLSPPGEVSVQIAPGLTAKIARDVIESVGEKKPNDLGRYEITLDPNDRWKYRTPSLRNVDLTAPYMHDGTFITLEDVIAFYNEGGEPNELLSPLIRPLNLSASEQNAIVAFLKSLTGSNVKTLVADAFAAPIGDTD